MIKTKISHTPKNTRIVFKPLACAVFKIYFFPWNLQLIRTINDDIRNQELTNTCIHTRYQFYERKPILSLQSIFNTKIAKVTRKKPFTIILYSDLSKAATTESHLLLASSSDISSALSSCCLRILSALTSRLPSSPIRKPNLEEISNCKRISSDPSCKDGNARFTTTYP